ncbi:hypothetical protein LCGC14_2344630 [marine sediment metagenome]|uniref:Uncharacterized protein n=1 Tax=marine sediment metagenome TaxID=412755 RepID=A0A0F9F634_9ZZZZ
MVNEQLRFEPILDPPEKHNGRVSQAELYRSLYLLDLGLSKRFTVLLEGQNDARDEIQQLRLDLENHRQNHPEPAKSRPKLTALFITVLTAIFTAVATIFREVFVR